MLANKFHNFLSLTTNKSTRVYNHGRKNHQSIKIQYSSGKRIVVNDLSHSVIT
jgi:hypothetical protein